MLAANRLHRFVALLIALSLSAVFAACTPIMPEAPAAEAPPSTQPADPCPTPGEGQLLLRNETDGYCLLYPAAYTLDQTNPGVTDIVVDNVMNHWDPRLSIAVSDAAGQTLEDIAAQLATDYAAGFGSRPSITVAAKKPSCRQPAGPGLNRRAAFLHGGTLYRLSSAFRRRRQRSSPAGGDALPPALEASASWNSHHGARAQGGRPSARARR